MAAADQRPDIDVLGLRAGCEFRFDLDQLFRKLTDGRKC